MIIKRHKQFTKAFDKLPIKIALKVVETLEVFSINPFDTSLNNHKLQGNLDEIRSINVTGDYRIHFRELSDGSYELVELRNIGTHSQLYG